ncbi:hypothetical protein NL676_029815 [Syzygium grande]|nr:hypothetical protein NL676_029815 [Syzygium grande]
MHILVLLFSHSAEILILGRNSADFGTGDTMQEEDHKEITDHHPRTILVHTQESSQLGHHALHRYNNCIIHLVAQNWRRGATKMQATTVTRYLISYGQNLRSNSRAIPRPVEHPFELPNHSAEVLRLGRNGADFGTNNIMPDRDHKELIDGQSHGSKRMDFSLTKTEEECKHQELF